MNCSIWGKMRHLGHPKKKLNFKKQKFLFLKFSGRTRLENLKKENFLCLIKNFFNKSDFKKYKVIKTDKNNFFLIGGGPPSRNFFFLKLAEK